MASATASPNKPFEPVASCTTQEWVIANISALKTRLRLPEFLVDGVHWEYSLKPSKDNKVLGLFLYRLTETSYSMRVKLSVTVVNQEDPAQNNQLVSDRIHEAGRHAGWGWGDLISTEPTRPGLVLHDTLVLWTRIRTSKDLRPGSVDGPLHEESYDFLSQSSLRLFRGKSASEPDVMLKLGDDKLPAHRSLLAESSDVFEAMFQSGMSESKSDAVEIHEIAIRDMEIIIKFIYGVLDAIPEEQLQSLLLACDRLQVIQLAERCVNQLAFRLTVDNFAETALLADRVSHQGLHEACVAFALLDENRLEIGNHQGLKRAMTEAPDFAFKLLGDVLKQSGSKSARKE